MQIRAQSEINELAHRQRDNPFRLQYDKLKDNKLIDVVLRQPLNERDAITDLHSAYLPTANGRMIPAGQIIQPVITWEPGVMWREGREYAITVQCDIIEGLQGATVTKELLPQLKALEAQWAKSDSANYRIEVAGAVEESSKGSSSISAGMSTAQHATYRRRSTPH